MRAGLVTEARSWTWSSTVAQAENYQLNFPTVPGFTDQGTASARLVSTQTHDAAKEAVRVENETQQGSGDARDCVLGRLWELANIGPDQTKGNIDGQVKAIAMMIEIVGLLPDEDATPAAAATNARMYVGKPYRRPGHTEPDEELEAAYKA